VRVRNFRCEYQIPIYCEGERAERRADLTRGGKPAGCQQDDRRSLTLGLATAGKPGLRRRALCNPGG
jgi:hypothetical protein